MSVPDWPCDCFRLTRAKGAGNGESLKYFAIKRGDCLLADRGFSHLAGMAHVQRQGGSVSGRLNQQNTPLEQADGRPVWLLDWLGQLAQPGQVGSLPVWLPGGPGAQDSIAARLGAVRKSVEAAALAQRKLKQQALRKQSTLRAATLEPSAWIVGLTPVDKMVLSDVEVREWYRVRWQSELAFKRLKSLGDVGQLPKREAAASRAWV